MKLAFYKGTLKENPKADMVDRAVTFWTDSKYSHCEIVFSGNTFFSASGRDKAVRFKTFRENPARWDYVDLDNFVHMHDMTEEKILARARAYDGDKYDYIGIFFTFIVPLGLQASNRWWCSEILGHILNIEFIDCYSPQELYLFAKKYEI